jgi:ribosomal-protein-alanine N-acetyltransferase
MEKMPYQVGMETQLVPAASFETLSSDWQISLPVLTGKQVVLRELRTSDAPALFAMLTTDEVARFISPPPSTVEGFVRFIEWTQQQRRLGVYACFAVTLRGFDTAIGIFQVHQLEAGFQTAEWGFAVGSPFWGSGVFQESAQLMLEFVFDTLDVHRLEARAAVQNGRGNSALRKVGAVREAILRQSLLRNGRYLDQVLYSILDTDWRSSREYAQPAVAQHVH